MYVCCGGDAVTTLHSLEGRLKRVEQRFRRKANQAPSRREYDDAASRSRTRNAYSSRWKLWKIKGWDEEVLLQSFSKRDQEFLENDSEEQRAKDAGVIERYRKAHGPGAEEIKGLAARAKMRLRRLAWVTEWGESE